MRSINDKTTTIKASSNDFILKCKGSGSTAVLTPEGGGVGFEVENLLMR